MGHSTIRIPHAGRNQPTGLDHAAHFLNSRKRIRHELENQLGNRSVESAVLKRKCGSIGNFKPNSCIISTGPGKLYIDLTDVYTHYGLMITALRQCERHTTRTTAQIQNGLPGFLTDIT